MSHDLSHPSPKPPSVPPGHVLVVDDEPHILTSCARSIAAMGLVVDTAKDGEQAKRLLAEREYNVVLSDITMPRVGGLELLAYVRARDLDVPVLLMTGNPDLSSAISAVEHGAARYLTKPFHEDVLQAAVVQALKANVLARIKREALRQSAQHQAALEDLATLGTAFDSALRMLHLVYQPIVHVGDRRVHAYEALMRSDSGLLPHPGLLLSAAERLGRLPALGQAVRSRAAATLSTHPDLTLFVNLHAADLNDPELYDPQSPLSCHARSVVLEITERTGFEDVDNIRGRLGKLRELGYTLAVDDLGAGYGGLTSFAQVEPEIVKIDMSLIRDLHREAFKHRLVSSIVRMCQDTGVFVVAEGVETVEERDALLALGCELLQGYYFSRPSLRLDLDGAQESWF